MRVLVLALLAIVPILAASTASGATLDAIASDLEFQDEAEALVVEFTIEGAAGLTGLEFSIVYPSDRLAVSEPSFHARGDLFSLVVVNHAADPTGLPPGFGRIAVAFSGAQPLGDDAGSLLSVSFPVRCVEFSGGWPTGRTVTVEIQDPAAWAADGAELPVPVAVEANGVSVNVDCTIVPVPGRGFTTLKARHLRGAQR